MPTKTEYAPALPPVPPHMVMPDWMQQAWMAYTTPTKPTKPGRPTKKTPQAPKKKPNPKYTTPSKTTKASKTPKAPRKVKGPKPRAQRMDKQSADLIEFKDNVQTCVDMYMAARNQSMKCSSAYIASDELFDGWNKIIRSFKSIDKDVNIICNELSLPKPQKTSPGKLKMDVPTLEDVYEKLCAVASLTGIQRTTAERRGKKPGIYRDVALSLDSMTCLCDELASDITEQCYFGCSDCSCSCSECSSSDEDLCSSDCESD